MYKILYLPTAQYVVSGESTHTHMKQVSFLSNKDAKETMKYKEFRFFSFERGKEPFVYLSDRPKTERGCIPKHLFEVVEC